MSIQVNSYKRINNYIEEQKGRQAMISKWYNYLTPSVQDIKGKDGRT